MGKKIAHVLITSADPAVMREVLAPGLGGCRPPRVALVDRGSGLVDGRRPEWTDRPRHGEPQLQKAVPLLWRGVPVPEGCFGVGLHAHRRWGFPCALRLRDEWTELSVRGFAATVVALDGRLKVELVEEDG